MDLPRLQHSPSLWEQVYVVLEEQLVERKLAPGTRLVETELANRLGVSRNPVREALRALERDGWVERQHGEGMRVVQAGGERGRHVFEVRRFLEAEAAALASKRWANDDLERLAEIVAAGYQALGDGDASVISALNSRFHSFIAELADNVVLIELQASLDKRARWHFSAIATQRGKDSWDEHALILEALRERDGAKVYELVQVHVDRSYAELKKHDPTLAAD